MIGYWWRKSREQWSESDRKKSDEAWARLYGEAELQSALRHTEWVLALPCPPECELSSRAASGEPELWPAHQVQRPRRGVLEMRSILELTAAPACPSEPPDVPAALTRAPSVPPAAGRALAGRAMTAGPPPPMPRRLSRRVPPPPMPSRAVPLPPGPVAGPGVAATELEEGEEWV